ncbi:aminodeoxychorismate lyase [Rathayibacter caricis DSM 15933]|uniref:Aminodeoxychorismate lyase n=1 Tax=Rathayibacter caricis DSM 15933 TaxID=1328867 RepID=A0A2T4UVM8_9MICO|nr:aminotransferase class IV [Rathayibacter caricis]PTL73579.1 aminodeoxychorismate lyase [Rathayibacter caricis DSM 15933]
MTSPVLVEIDDSGTAVLRDPSNGLVAVDEPGYLRGDGVFETLAVLRGRPHGLDEHLSRLEASAAAVDLALPPRVAWTAAVALAVAEHDAVDDLSVRLVASHRASAARCTVRAEPTADASALRRDGVAVVVLDRGYPSGAQEAAPWLLGGVKSTSGAVTRAALREAHRRGADDVVWRTSDGLLLEGATSSLVLLTGGALLTPSAGSGILDGTTVARILDIGTGRGLETARRELPAAALGGADSAWLVSSTRRAVPIRSVDGVGLRLDRELTDAFERGLLAE